MRINPHGRARLAGGYLSGLDGGGSIGIPPGTVEAFDDFNRTDSASAIGNAVTGGGTWFASAGTWGISSNKAYRAAGTNQCNAYLTTTKADVYVQADITLSASRASSGIIARMNASSTACLFAWLKKNGSGVNDSIALYEWTSPSTYTAIGTTVTSAGLVLGQTYQLRLRCNGTAITLSVDGVTKITATSTHQQTAVRHGLFQFNEATNDDGGTRFEDFYVTY